MLIDAVQKFSQHHLLKSLSPTAEARQEHGTWYVGISLGDKGFHVLGYGASFDDAFDAALQNEFQ